MLVNICANRVIPEGEAMEEECYEQLSLFTDYGEREAKEQEEQKARERERRLQEVMLSVKKRYGKNAMLKGTNLQEGAMTKERNNQIGGHKA